MAFLGAAVVGLLMEQFVVRHLYNRPLESLLATWGRSAFDTARSHSIWGQHWGNPPTRARELQ